MVREFDLTHWQADTSDAARRGVTLQRFSGSVSGATKTLILGTEMGYVGLSTTKSYCFSSWPHDLCFTGYHKHHK